jgi:hypothetical protein
MRVESTVEETKGVALARAAGFLQCWTRRADWMGVRKGPHMKILHCELWFPWIISEAIEIIQ